MWESHATIYLSLALFRIIPLPSSRGLDSKPDKGHFLQASSIVFSLATYTLAI